MIERYRLFVARNDQVVLVDPNTRVVVDVVPIDGLTRASFATLSLSTSGLGNEPDAMRSRPFAFGRRRSIVRGRVGPR